MRKLLLLVPFAMLAGCIVRPGYSTYRPVTASAPASARADVYFYGNHFIPESAGGGWCYLDGPHAHDYYPDRDDYYDYDQGYYWYRGPFLFSFLGGHPLPGGSWCFLSGSHHHDYFPPSGRDWRWNRSGYVYQGQYRPNRPPPATYWPRPAPRQDWRTNRPAVRPAPARPFRPGERPAPSSGPAWGPGRDRPDADDRSPRPGGPVFGPGRDRPDADDRTPRPGPAWGRDRPDGDDRGPQPAPAPAPEPRGWPGASGAAPGHGDNLPPGQGGVPPGQVRPRGFEPPGQDGRDNGRDRLGRPDSRQLAPTPSSPPADDRKSAKEAKKEVEKKKQEKAKEAEEERRPRPFGR